jgi:hypothetical protein
MRIVISMTEKEVKQLGNGRPISISFANANLYNLTEIVIEQRPKTPKVILEDCKICGAAKSFKVDNRLDDMVRGSCKDCGFSGLISSDRVILDPHLKDSAVADMIRDKLSKGELKL